MTAGILNYYHLSCDESSHAIDEWFESGTFPSPGAWKKLI